MKYKYIFFDWGYTLINKFKNVDSEINSILVKYNLKWDDIFRKWKNYQILNSLGKVTEKEIYKDLSLILNISEEDLEKIDMLLLESHILDKETLDLVRKHIENSIEIPNDVKELANQKSVVEENILLKESNKKEKISKFVTKRLTNVRSRGRIHPSPNG